MRVLIACEYSGRMRDAFIALGHDAMSCDFLPTDVPGPHFQGDMWDIVDDGWDLAIFHPSCTYLTCSAEWAYNDPNFEKYPGVGYHQKVKPETLVGAARREARDVAVIDFRRILDLDIPRIAVENPGGVISTRIRPPNQTIQPFEYGDDASKKTCLWLKGLAPLVPTQNVPGRSAEWPRGSGKFVERWANQTDSGQNNLPPTPDRWKLRSETYQGIANAAASQWGMLTET